MSTGTKAIHEALDWLENNPTAEKAQDARRRAREEVEAIDQASTKRRELAVAIALGDKDALESLAEMVLKETT